MRITREKIVLYEDTYLRVYEVMGQRGRCVTVPCRKDGTPTEDKPVAAGPDVGELVDRGVVSHLTTVVLPAVGECECGEKVTLPSGVVTTCRCGIVYDDRGATIPKRDRANNLQR